MDAKVMSVRHKAVWGSAMPLILVLSAASVAGCGDAATAGRGPSVLVLESLTGASTATPQTFQNVVASDVLRAGGIIEDQGRAVMHVELKDKVTAPTPANAVTITRYRVVYTRADGRNTPGVDVPYPFDGAVTQTVTGSAATVTFALVRVQAKLEPPLQGLRFDGGANVISTIAEVTFYGTDPAGHAVSVTGQLGVNFSDWGG